MILVADTSGIIAASDKNAPEAARCQAALADAGTVLVSPLVLAKVDHLALARFGSGARSALVDFILFQAQRDRFLIPHVTVALLETARKVQRKYAGLDLHLADAVKRRARRRAPHQFRAHPGPPRLPRDPPAHPAPRIPPAPPRHVTNGGASALLAG